MVRKRPSEPREETLTSVLAARLVRLLASREGDAKAMAARFGLPEDAAERRDVLITREDLRRLAEACVASTGDPALGITLGRTIDRGAYGLVEFIARSALTLREGLLGMLRYQRLTGAGERYSYTEEREVVVLEHQGFPEIRVANEHALVVALEVGRQLTGQRWTAHRAWFAHERPADVAVVEEFLGTSSIEFGAPRNGVVFGVDWLSMPVRSADPQLREVLEQQAQQVLQQRPNEGDLLAQVREQVRLSLRDGTINLERVASQLATSSRTLQRRLDEQGVAFHEVVDDVRRTLSQLYLANRSLGLAEVAYLLGYSDLRAFLRAYKRWTGTTPSEARRTLTGK
jgi:AraC-like DNA-binding protein